MTGLVVFLLARIMATVWADHQYYRPEWRP